MSKDDVIETEGVVVEAMPGATFKVKIAGGHIVTAYLSGKLWKNFIHVYEPIRFNSWQNYLAKQIKNY